MCQTSWEFVVTSEQGMTYFVLMFPAPVVSVVFTTKHSEESRERFKNNYAFSLVVAFNLTQIQKCYFLIGYYQWLSCKISQGGCWI